MKRGVLGLRRLARRRPALRPFALLLVRHASLLAVINLDGDREIWCEGLAFLQDLG